MVRRPKRIEEYNTKRRLKRIEEYYVMRRLKRIEEKLEEEREGEKWLKSTYHEVPTLFIKGRVGRVAA